MPKIEHPKVFISYTWSNEEYIRKVVDFANRLLSDGIDVVLDQFQMKLGHDMNNFMEKSVSDSSITNVLILLSPDYKEKADLRKGGAGIETQIISGEVYSNIENTKFIPILFEKRGESAQSCVPTYLKQRRWLDMSEDSDFESQYIDLVKTLYGRDKFVKNSLGSKPSWIDDENNTLVNQQIIVNKYKATRKEFNSKKAIYESLDTSLKLYGDLSITLKEVAFSNEKFEEFYPLFHQVRDPYLAFISEAKFDDNLADNIHDFFSSCYELMVQNKDNIIYETLSKIFIHELFIETIAIFLKTRNYVAISELVFTPYTVKKYSRNKLGYFNELFYSNTDSYVDNISIYLGKKLYPNPEKGYYYSGIGEFWMRNIPYSYINKKEFIDADCLLSNLSIAGGFGHWFALTYLYLKEENESIIASIASMMRSKKLSQKIYPLFDCVDSEMMKASLQKVIDFENAHRYTFGYSGAYRSIPLLSNFINIEDFEIEK